MVSPGSRVLRFEKRESEREIHPCIHPHAPTKTANQEQREQEGGGGEGRDEDTQKERKHMSMLEKPE